MTEIKRSKLGSPELVSKGFPHTPNGLIFTNDIKAVYSIFLICLRLKEETKQSKRLFGSFNKTYPFTFSVQQAIEKMKRLEITSDMNSTCISLSYHIKENLANHLLTIFISAKLLHFPADRTRSEPKEGVLLQPTPKGVSILQKYSRDIGLKDIPEILLSSFNSIELFTFERSSVSDFIIHSDYLIHILFIKLMGSKPNVWSALNPSDKLPSLSKLLEYSNDTFTFENFNFSAFSDFGIGNKGSEKSNSWSDQVDEDKLQNEGRESPFAHKFFTNPDSDSHIQYYVSNKGVRLFKSKVFGTNKTVIEYSFTTKAIWQWLMDCTDIIYPKEAIAVAALFLKMGLIVPIILPPSENSRRKFSISRSSYYTLTKLGWDIIQWNTHIDFRKSINDFSNLKIESPKESCIDTSFTISGHMIIADERKSLPDSFENPVNSNQNAQISELDDILHDPGMRYLFRLHLEKEFCPEILDSYIEIRTFLKRMTILKKLLESKSLRENKIHAKSKLAVNEINRTMDSALVKHANECLETAYRIYSSYVMVCAPYQLNIDHTLRESISAVMLNPKSPLSSNFQMHFETCTEESSNIDMKKYKTSLNSLSKPSPALSRNKVFTRMGSPSLVGRDFKPAPLNLSAKNTDKSSMDGLTLNEDNKFDSTLESNYYSADDLSGTIKILQKLYPLLESVGDSMYSLMKRDSLQKFQASDIFRETMALIGGRPNKINN